MRNWKKGYFHELNQDNSKGVDFSDCDITGSIFLQCDLAGISFAGSIISDCQFVDCRLPVGMWTNASVIGVNDFVRCTHVPNGPVKDRTRTERLCAVCKRWCDLDVPCWWCGTR